MKLFFCINLLILFGFISCKSKNMQPNNTISYAFRLKPGQDLKLSIDSFVKEKNIQCINYEIIHDGGNRILYD